MKHLNRIFFFASLGLFYFVFKEFLELYFLLNSFHPYLAWGVLIALLAGTIYFAIVPILSILMMGTILGPTYKESEVPRLRQKRIQLFSKKIDDAEQLKEVDDDQKHYEEIVKILNKKNKQIRDKYILRTFHSTAVSQNGFLDAIIILSLGVNLIKETFKLYNGRVSTKDSITIARMILVSIAIGGSEGAENLAANATSKYGGKLLKSIPFAGEIAGSVADGLFNALLIARIGFLAENYCTVLHVQKFKDLYPNYAKVAASTSAILTEPSKSLGLSIKNIFKRKETEE